MVELMAASLDVTMAAYLAVMTVVKMAASWDYLMAASMVGLSAA